MLATVFAVDVKTRLPAAPRLRFAVFTTVCPAMALTALTTAPACAQPGRAGQVADPKAPAKACEADPGPAP